MLLIKRRLIGKFIGVATAALFILAMMPGLAPAEDSLNLPHDGSTPSEEVVFSHESSTSSEAIESTTDIEQSSAEGSETSEENVIESDKQVIDNSTNELIQEKIFVTNQVDTTTIKKEVSIDGINYYDDDPVTIGLWGIVYYKLSFENQTDELTSVEITDNLPDGFIYINNTAKLGDDPKEPNISSQELKWTNLTIPVDGVITYQVMASEIPSSADPFEPYGNTATAEPELGSDSAYVVVSDNLLIDKRVSGDGTSYSDGPVTVGPGDTVYFKIEVANNGQTPESNLRIDDSLPEGFSFIEDTAEINGEPQAPSQPEPGVYTWELSKPIGPKDSQDSEGSFGDTVTLEFQATASSIVSSVSYINVSQIVKLGDSPVYFASDVVEVYVGPSLIKTVKKKGSTDNFAENAEIPQGEIATYQIVIENPYVDISLSNVKIEDTLPPDFKYVSGSSKISWNDGANEATKENVDADPDEDTVNNKFIWPKSDSGFEITIGPEKNLTLTYDVEVSKTISETPYENIAVFSAVSSSDINADTNGDLNVYDTTGATPDVFGSDTAKVNIALKNVKKEVSTDGTNYSDEVSVATNAIAYYRITITNGDPDNDITVDIEDTLPTGFTYQTDTTSGATANNPAVNGQKLTWSGVNVTKGTDTVLKHQVKASNTVGDSNVNTVKILQDTEQELGTDTANVKISGTPSLSITKSVDKSSASPGDTLIYTITYKNTGDVELTNVVITDGIPDHTTYIDASATNNGVYDQTANAITWTVGSVQANISGYVQFKVTINSDATGTIANTASIDTDQTDVVNATVNTSVTVVLATNQQPAALPNETGNQAASEAAAAQQLPSTLPKTGLDLLAYLFSTAMLILAGIFFRRLGRNDD